MNNEKKYRQYGYRLAEARTRAGLMQKEVAKHLGVKDNVISYFENGDRLPSVEQYKELSKLFNVSADYLLGISEAKTNDKDLQFVCDYTGLSADSIEKIREYCVFDLSTFSASILPGQPEEDVALDIKFEKEHVEEYKQIIDDFILSDAFDGVANHGWQVQYLNKSVMSYLALYFGDYEYFFELKKEENTIKNIQLFLNEYEHDYIHGAFTDRIDMFSFKLQKSMLNYADKLFIFNEFKDVNIEGVFDWIKFVVWSSVHPVYEENGNIVNIQENIKAFMRDDYIEEISKLKTIYEKLKKGGINGNDS